MYLLDTHVLLWLRLDPHRVARSVRERLASPGASLFLSAASGWEIALKQLKATLTLPAPVQTWLPVALDELRCSTLSLDLRHMIEAVQLPLHHRDPFDRMIVAQARLEDLTVVTSDKAVMRYDVPVLRA
jgi:PIN domain nuclease of toxin-antitoxin system